VSYGEVLMDKSATALILRVLDFILRVLDYIVTISFGYILYRLFLNCFVMCGCVCVGFVMCVFW